jgi:hypothetical protein
MREPERGERRAERGKRREEGKTKRRECMLRIAYQFW